MHVRYLAWLWTAPDPPPSSSRLDSIKSGKPLTRLAKMEAAGLAPDLVQQPAPHIISYLMEMGPVEPAGMDNGPISWITIQAWQDQTGINLPSWQARLIRRLSLEYLAEMRRAKDEGCPDPRLGITEATRAAVSLKIRSILGGMARNAN